MSRDNRWGFNVSGYEKKERGEIKLDKMMKLRIAVSERRIGKHDVYWGAHACDRQVGHTERMCICSCGAVPTAYSLFWGDDAPEFSAEERTLRLNVMVEVDSSWGMTIVEGNIEEAIVNGRYDHNRRPSVRRIKGSIKSRTEAGYS